jgi:hypothetical protein
MIIALAPRHRNRSIEHVCMLGSADELGGRRTPLGEDACRDQVGLELQALVAEPSTCDSRSTKECRPFNARLWAPNVTNFAACVASLVRNPPSPI